MRTIQRALRNRNPAIQPCLPSHVAGELANFVYALAGPPEEGQRGSCESTASGLTVGLGLVEGWREGKGAVCVMVP